MVEVVGAVGAPRAGGAAPVPHIPHQEPRPGYQQQTALAVYGVPAPSSYPYAPSTTTSTSSPTTASSHSPLLLIQEQAELLELQVLADHFLLPQLQLLELLQVEGDLLAHDAGTVAAQTLPLPGHALALLAVVVQEAAQVPQLPIILLELLVNVLGTREGERDRGEKEEE